jgi:hypothetical protein
MPNKNFAAAAPVWPLITTPQIPDQLGVSVATLKRWKRLGLLTQGIHYHKVAASKAMIFWNRDLLRDYIANGGDSPSHRRACESYTKSLPSSAA